MDPCPQSSTTPQNIFDYPNGGSEAAGFFLACRELGRNIILVGHDLKADEAYLRVAGFDLHDPSNSANVVAGVDTQGFCRFDKRKLSLPRLMKAFEVPLIDVHNGGNDAARSLEALAGIIVLKSQQGPGSVEVRAREAAEGDKPKLERDENFMAPICWGGIAVRGE